ncbi:MAG: rRNA maturation RNase YbeY [Treponema sp.]|nr:rRNA maturation RNase YbeY [Spirochaetia bacterium]MDY2840404.1 rRNA maturation RNase YbeY [Treponema sp.]MDY5123113.1 rRNA maturation RNase YbeY [Treponema sp.]
MKNRVLITMQEGVSEPDWLGNVEPFMQLVMKKLHFNHEEVSIMFCNDSYIQELNKNYRQIDSATDVLSFENEESYKDEEGKWKCAGDIAISLDMLPVNAEYFNVDNNNELKRLLVHGLLHLNGYDHGEEHIEKGVEPECKMLKKQEKLLLKLKDEIIIK